VTNSVVALFVLALATYRVARLIVIDDVMLWFRNWVEDHANKTMIRRDWMGKTVATKTATRSKLFAGVWMLISCVWCVSVWAAAIVIVLWHYQHSWFQYAAYALALSTLATIIHVVTERIER
jgi:hypothetical protein